MSEPNVSFIGENIIYNYPIESHIYILNRQDGSRKTIEADSEHTPNKANKCSSKTDYSAWIKHGFENPHFYDVMYIPSLKMYVRLHAGPIDLPDANHPEEVAYKRSLYAMFFDSAFSIFRGNSSSTRNLQSLYKLERNPIRNSLFCGWPAKS